MYHFFPFYHVRRCPFFLSLSTKHGQALRYELYCYTFAHLCYTDIQNVSVGGTI